MFFYFEEYVVFGYRNKYDVNNIIPLEDDLKVDTVLNDYQANYKDKYLKESKFDNYNILHLIIHLYKFALLFNIFIFIIQILLSQLEPQIILWLITYVGSENETEWHGYFYTIGLLFSSMTRVTIVGIFNRNMNYLQAKVQIILVNHIYKKALRRSILKDNESFDTYNLMTVDLGNILNALYFSFDAIQIPVNVTLSIYFIYQQIGKNYHIYISNMNLKRLLVCVILIESIVLIVLVVHLILQVFLYSMHCSYCCLLHHSSISLRKKPNVHRRER